MIEAANVEFRFDGTVTIFGISYDIELFRHLGLGPVGSVIKILKREDGVVTLQRLYDVERADTRRAEHG